MDTQTQIDRLIELAIIQRTELKQLVEQLPQLREHLNAEVEKVFEETEPQLRSELEEWTTKQTADKTAALGVTLEAKIAELAKSLEVSTQARYSAIISEREENARLAAQAEAKIAEHAASLPSAVKEIVSAELARFPRAGEIDQLRKEFAEPRGLNPRGKWQAGETYNRLDLVTYNGDSFVSNIDGNTEKPSRNAANWTLNAARGAYGGGGGITSLNDVLNAPTSGQIIGSQNGQYVPKTLVAGANITINETASSITIIGDEGQISLQDGTAAAPSLFFTNDTDTGIYRPTANTLGVAVGGAQVAYFDANGITTVGAGATIDGSVHAANGNANNPSLSFTGDQDTGFFRHQPNELGIALGGTQYATLTSTTFSITPNLSTSGNLTVSGGKVLISYPSSSQARVSFGGAHFDANSSYASYIRGYSSSATTAGLDFYTTYGSSVLALSLSEQGNATFGGNLTVSGGTLLFNQAVGQYQTFNVNSGGTGDQVEIKYQQVGNGRAGIYFGTAVGGLGYMRVQVGSGGGTTALLANSTGNVLIGTTTDAASGARLQAQLTGTDGTVSTLLSLRKNTNAAGTGVAIDFTPDSTDNPLAKLSAVRTSLVNGYTDFRFSTWSGSALAEQLRLVGQTGNLIIGSPFTDGGQKLQVNGTAYVSGRLTTNTGTLVTGGESISTGAGQPIGVQLRYGSVADTAELLAFDWANNGAKNLTLRGTTVTLQTGTYGGTTALTLDSSQNATFAGNITVDKATPAILVKRGANTQNGQLQFATGASGDFAIGNRGTSDSDLHVYNYGLAADSITISKNTSAVTFAGAIAIGNTVQTAASVASTHKVTVVIGGVTYYLLATNV